MRPIRLAVLTLLCLGAFSSAPAARRAHSQSLREGLALYQKADFEGALKHFDAVASSKTAAKADRAHAYQYAGLMHVALGRAHYSFAEKDIKSMIQLDPSARPDPEEFPASYMRLYYKAASTAGAFAEAPQSGVTTLAIMDFDNNSIGDGADKYAALGRGLSQMLITDLVAVPGLRLVEREKVRYVLDELNLAKSGAVDPQTAAKVGKLLGAQALLFGGAMVNDGDLRVSWRLVKVETGEILKAGNTDGEAKKLFDVEKKLALSLPEDLKIAVAPEVEKKIQNSDKPSLDAAMAYSEGLKHLDEGKTQLAYAKFEQAAKLDPKFSAAQNRMKKIKPLAKVS
jgi:TolB-like protein